MDKVVITGIGVIAPKSIGKQEFWSNLYNGINCTKILDDLNSTKLLVKIGGRVDEFKAEDYKKVDFADKLSRAEQLALAGIDMAILDSKLDKDYILKKNITVSIGSTMGIENVDLEEWDSCDNKEIYFVEKYSAKNIIAAVCKYLKLKNPNVRMFMNACAASNYSIGYGFEQVRTKSDIAIVGGVDSFSVIALTGFNRLLSLTPDICRPFDKDRKGLIVSEGCGFLILEKYEHALKRNANIYAEIKGYGLGEDAYHITSPSPDAFGAIKAMDRAIKKSNLKPEDIDYINTHGTGTPANDKIECKAIKEIFNSKIPPVSSIKSMIGHTMGASAAIAAISNCLMLQNQIIIPTANYKTFDSECDIDCVPNKPRKAKLNNVMSNAFAFGGNNSSVIFSKI